MSTQSQDGLNTSQNQSTGAEERSNTTTNVNERGKRNSLWDEIPIENSPFKIIGNEEKGWCAVLGRHRLSETKATAEQVKDWMEENVWTVIFNVVATMIQINEDSKESERKARQSEMNEHLNL